MKPSITIKPLTSIDFFNQLPVCSEFIAKPLHTIESLFIKDTYISRGNGLDGGTNAAEY